MNSGSGVGALFGGPAGQKKVKRVNYAANNRRDIKNLQARNQARRAEEDYQASKPKFTMKQFAQVGSKINQIDENANTQNKHNFLRRTVEQPVESKPYVSTKVKHTKAVPSSKIKVPHHERKNFVRNNKSHQGEAPLPQKPKPTKLKAQPHHSNYGKVPKYLQQRNNEAALEAMEQEKQAEIDANRGMKKMPEEERLQVLAALTRNYENLAQELHRFPLVVETPILRKKKKLMEDKLKEISEARDKFSNPNIWIQV